jgi:hypothetical protein
MGVMRWPMGGDLAALTKDNSSTEMSDIAAARVLTTRWSVGWEYQVVSFNAQCYAVHDSLMCIQRVASDVKATGQVLN